MITINNLYKSDICLYHPYEDQFFGYFIQYNKLMKNINKKLLCIKNNKNTLFLKDIYTIDFGDTSNLVGYTHNNRYKPSRLFLIKAFFHFFTSGHYPLRIPTSKVESSIDVNKSGD